MNLKIQEKLLLRLIKENPGINLYQLRKKLDTDLKIFVGYSTIYRYIQLLEAKNLIITKLKPQKYVRKIYLKEEKETI